MAEAFGFYASNIVTKDYLDETLRARFAEQDVRFIQRFAEQDARMAAGFAEICSSQRQLVWMIGGTWLLVGYPLLLDLLGRLAQS
jgi:hypothetical protein